MEPRAKESAKAPNGDNHDTNERTDVRQEIHPLKEHQQDAHQWQASHLVICVYFMNLASWSLELNKILITVPILPPCTLKSFVVVAGFVFLFLFFVFISWDMFRVSPKPMSNVPIKSSKPYFCLSLAEREILD